MLQLSLEGVGPFRQGVQTFSFIGETGPLGSDPESELGPSNLYMLIAPNGMGKTTILEAIYGLLGLLAHPAQGQFSDIAAEGTAQLDIRATWTLGGAARTVLLSIWTGRSKPVFFWTDEEREARGQAGHWAQLGLGMNESGVYPLEESDDLGLILFNSIRSALGESPTELPSRSQHLPTILYFPADRAVVAPRTERIVAQPDHWGYQPAFRFSQDGPEWASSIDNLLIWLEWLKDERLEILLNLVNEHVFAEESNKVLMPPRMSELLTYVSTTSGEHPISALSHGERSLLQMFTRVFSHMTLNTVLLIDEIELHLHTKWMNRMYQSLKRIVADTPALSLIFTTHDRELIQVFDYERPERGLTKGGFLITDEII